MAKPKFSFIKDEPLGADSENFFKFYHSNIAPALKRILKSNSSPHTIGLFGSWGTGKSSIIKILQDDSSLQYPIFIFDAWKYQEDSLRRTFLIKLVDFLKANSFDLGEDILAPLYKSTALTVSSNVSTPIEPLTCKERLIRFLKHRWLPVTIAVLAIIWLILEMLAKNNLFFKSLAHVLGTLTGLSVVAYFFKPAFESIMKEAIAALTKPIIDAEELHTKTQHEERLNSPEQFEAKFKEIIAQVDQKMIIVFDNIDRVQGDTAISMLSTIKTFMDPANNSDLVFIIPCDAAAIESQIIKYYAPNPKGATEQAIEEYFDPSDYLRKIFNLIVWVPEFISTDLEEYTKKCLAATDMEELTRQEDIVLVINSAFSKNPREIIQFINNLVAAVVTASETEVWETIKNNIAYLAKVLVLKQKFPRAYNSLKEKWYAPESIIEPQQAAKELDEFSNFMNQTSRITVDDAEPFIYLKNPTKSRNLRHSDELKSALVTGDMETCLKVIPDEDKSALAEFIGDLLRKYTGQQNVLFNVFVTQLNALSQLDIVLQQKRYYDSLAKTLDSHLWQSYKDLPVDRIFEILNSQYIDTKLRRVILERYVVAINPSEQTSVQDTELVVRILTNFRRYPERLSSTQIAKIRFSIEEGYANNEDVIKSFPTTKDQDTFITPASLTQYIENIDSSNITGRVDTIIIYKQFVVNNQLLDFIVKKLTDVLIADNTRIPDYTDVKGQILTAINQVLNSFKNEYETIEETLRLLYTTLISTFNGISSWDNKSSVINSMRWLKAYDPQPGTNSISTFFGSTASTITSIKAVFDYWSPQTRQSLLSDYVSYLMPRLTTEGDLLEYIYGIANNQQRLDILTYLIRQSNNHIAFLQKLDKLPGRVEILNELIAKANGLTYSSRPPYYTYIANKLNKNDSRETKDAVIVQIKELLKNDDAAAAEVGFNFMQSLGFLSDTDKREIATNILEWLRQPGKSVTSGNRFALKALSYLFDNLQSTPQNDVVYLLFNLLSDSSNLETISMSAERLAEVQPRYIKYKKDYDDLLERIRNWPSDERRDAIIKAIWTLKPQKIGNKEKAFWDSVDSLDQTQS